MKPQDYRITFLPNQRNEETTVEVSLVDDSINEEEEGFLLVIEVEDATDTVSRVRDGVALININDNDREYLAFQYV